MKIILTFLLVMTALNLIHAEQAPEWMRAQHYDLETRRAHPADVFTHIEEESKKMDPYYIGVTIALIDPETDHLIMLHGEDAPKFRSLIQNTCKSNDDDPPMELTIYFDNYSIEGALHTITKILCIEWELRPDNLVVLKL